MDNDGSKSISAKELEDPLIALGFVASHDKVKELIAEVDEDGSEKIEFDEFLLIMMSIKKKSKEDSKGSSSLYEFFKGMIDGNLDKMGDMDNSLPFMLNYSLYRRRRILDAIMGETDEKKKEGQKIMKVVVSLSRTSPPSSSATNKKNWRKKAKTRASLRSEKPTPAN